MNSKVMTFYEIFEIEEEKSKENWGSLKFLFLESLYMLFVLEVYDQAEISSRKH